jgi:hypothetical protein
MKTVLAVVLAFVLVSPAARAQSYPQSYDIADRDKAQAEARDRNLPLAWLGGFHDDLKATDVERGSEAELTQMALTYLQGQAVVIFFEGSNMGPVPAIVHAQDHMADDGSLEGGASWLAPKIVFTNSQVTRALGRVSETQMKNDRESAISTVLQKILRDPAALQPDTEPVPTPSAPAPLNVVAPDASTSGTTAPDAPVPVVSPDATSEPAAASEPEETNAPGLDDEALDMSPEERGFWAWIHQDGVYAGFAVIFFLVCSLALTRKGPK